MFRCHLTCYKKYKSFVPAKLDTALGNAVLSASQKKAQKSRLNFLKKGISRPKPKLIMPIPSFFFQLDPNSSSNNTTSLKPTTRVFPSSFFSCFFPEDFVAGGGVPTNTGLTPPKKSYKPRGQYGRVGFSPSLSLPQSKHELHLLPFSPSFLESQVFLPQRG